MSLLIAGTLATTGVALANGGPGAKATGGATWTRTTTDGGQNSLQLIAMKDKNGNPTGTVHVLQRNADGSLQRNYIGKVDCFDYSNSTAFVGGDIVNYIDGTDVTPPTRFRAAVTDNGEGKNATPDLAYVAIGGSGAQACNVPNGFPNVEIEQGNFQVIG